MSEALAAAGKALLKMIAVDTATDKKKRNAVLIAIGSIIAALVAVMLLPVVVIYAIMNSEPPSIEVSIDEAAILSQLDDEQLAAMADIESDWQAIAEAMEDADLQEQTIKAQLIYVSCFEDNRITGFTEYAAHFSLDGEELVQALNDDYRLDIDYDEYMTVFNFKIGGISQ